jgi:putative addiction module component (TIGR02574 family)
MSLSSDFISQAFSLPANERYELAQHLLDSIDEKSAAKLDEEFVAELERRHDDMVRGESTITDWRKALSEIEDSLTQGRPVDASNS